MYYSAQAEALALPFRFRLMAISQGLLHPARPTEPEQEAFDDFIIGYVSLVDHFEAQLEQKRIPV
jgi:hypothetical protein